MTKPPLIFDRALLRSRLARAARRPGDPCDFLVARDGRRPRFSLSGDQPAFFPRPRSRLAASGISQALAAPGRLVLRAAPASNSRARRRAADRRRGSSCPSRRQSFDLVVCALNLQFVNDLPGVLAQIRRILAPDGLFLAAAGRRPDACANCASASPRRRRRSRAAPARASRLSPICAISAACCSALDSPCRWRIATPSPCATPSAFDLMRDLRAMGATNALAAGARRPLAPRRGFAAPPRFIAENIRRSRRPDPRDFRNHLGVGLGAA